MWVRRIGSLAVGLLLVLGACSVAIAAAVARPIDPIRVSGTLTRFVADFCVIGEARDQCAFIDTDQFCYRIHPRDFQPTLPSLSERIGQPISFVVDKANYETSRSIGDPYCNFEVGQIIVTDSGRETRYSTPAMTQPEFVGHARSDIVRLLVPFSILLGTLIAWNALIEIRRRRRRR